MPEPVDYLLVGHVVADVVPNGYTIGGTVAYGTRTAHAFGLRVGVLTSCRRDEPLLAELRPYAEVVIVESVHTTTYDNHYTPQGRVQYVRAVAGNIRPEHVPNAWRRTPAVHIAPLTDEVAFSIDRAFDGSAIMLTPQGWMRQWDADGRVSFKQWHDPALLSRVDVVVISEEDIASAPDLEGRYAADTKRLVVTQGQFGGRYYTDDGEQSYSAVESETVDPTGAGDIFATSLFAAWHRLGDFDRAINVAARLAAKSVTRPGIAGAPTPDEVADALRSA